MATEVWPSSATRSTSFLTSQAPSSREYSVCRWRWVNSGIATSILVAGWGSGMPGRAEEKPSVFAAQPAGGSHGLERASTATQSNNRTVQCRAPQEADEVSITVSVRHDPDRRGTRASADHGLEVRAAFVFNAVGIVNAIVDRTIHRLENDLLRYAGGDDSPRLLPYRGLIPAGFLPIVTANVKGIVDPDRPDPGWRAIRDSIFTKRRDVETICLGDLAQFII